MIVPCAKLLLAGHNGREAQEQVRSWNGCFGRFNRTSAPGRLLTKTLPETGHSGTPPQLAVFARCLFIQARGALKKELMAYLRRTHAMRRSQHHTQETSIHGRITDAVSISERPATADDRALPGHWER